MSERTEQESVDPSTLDLGSLKLQISWDFEGPEAVQEFHITALATLVDDYETWVQVGYVEIDLVNLSDDWWWQLDGRDGDGFTLAEGLRALVEDEDDPDGLERHDSSRSVLVERVWVRPELRGRKLGRRILTMAIKAMDGLSIDEKPVLTYPMPDEAADESEQVRARASAELLGRLGLQWRQTGHPGVVWEYAWRLLAQDPDGPAAGQVD